MNTIRKGLVFHQAIHVDEYLCDPGSRYVQNVSLKLTLDHLAKELKQEMDNGKLSLSKYQMDHAAQQNSDQEGEEFLGKFNDNENRNKDMLEKASDSSLSCQAGTSDVLRALQRIVEKYEREDTDGVVIYEWRQIAISVDNILFSVFLVATLVSTVVVLVIVPYAKWS